MAIALADEEDIPLVLANDPDADRFCAAERNGDKWHIFTGNEMGIILAHHIFTRSKSQPNFNPGTTPYKISNHSWTGDVIFGSVVQDVRVYGRERGFPP
jgi:phosphomannomutase